LRERAFHANAHQSDKAQHSRAESSGKGLGQSWTAIHLPDGEGFRGMARQGNTGELPAGGSPNCFSEATMENLTKAMLVAEGLYDQPTCDMMTAAEAETLWQLHQMGGKAFDAACDELASILGRDKSQLSDKQKADIVEEVEFLAEEFDEADVAGRYQRDVTPLIACLKRHHELGLQIMNVRDVIVARSVPEHDED
jgi:hypothetical protein